ncbi:hypothetical protein CMI37_00245 [Candidatus Pacearchaeota archaeon]|nr:hypothetical protein [Candidatus Pacearchaeota archaeon]
MYQADSDDNTKSSPKPLQVSVFGRAIAPAAEAEVDRASYVIINVEHGTKYEFLYESGGTYVDYGIVAADGPLRININPIAWKGGAGTTGHVSFIYRGGL